MAYPFTDTPKIGVDLNNVVTPEDYPRQSHRVLSQIFGADGRTYVFAKAGANISADATTVTVNATTGAATATGGSYRAPNVAVPNGSYAWFSKAGA